MQDIAQVSNNIGVAFLAETIYLSGNTYTIRARQNKLFVPSDTYLEAVIHIESDYRKKLQVSPEELDSLVLAINRWAKCPSVKSIQIDFDAKETERQFYKELLDKVGHSLYRNCNLSITALASWCLGDRWINDLPADEIVPMLFNMGIGTNDVIHYIETSSPAHLDLLEKCVGISPRESSILELLKKHLSKTPSRVYIFSSSPWKINTIQSIVNNIRN